MVERLLQETVEHSFISCLFSDQYFLQWGRLSLNHSLHMWIHSLVIAGRTETGSKTLNYFCQQVITQYLKIMIASIKIRRKTEYTSYETGVWVFLCSDQFRNTAERTLPKSMHISNYRPGCVVLAMCLNRNMERMTREALTASLKQRSPSLFEKTVGDSLTPMEKNGEVNRFLGWAIFSTQKKFEDDQPEHKILNAMHCKLDDLDTHYIEKYYDRHMSMLNTGGMTLVSGEFFEWGRKVMDVVRKKISHDLFQRDPKKGLDREKTAILKDECLRNAFSEICKKKRQIASLLLTLCATRFSKRSCTPNTPISSVGSKKSRSR